MPTTGVLRQEGALSGNQPSPLPWRLRPSSPPSSLFSGIRRDPALLRKFLYASPPLRKYGVRTKRTALPPGRAGSEAQGAERPGALLWRASRRSRAPRGAGGDRAPAALGQAPGGDRGARVAAGAWRAGSRGREALSGGVDRVDVPGVSGRELPVAAGSAAEFRQIVPWMQSLPRRAHLQGSRVDSPPARGAERATRKPT